MRSSVWAPIQCDGCPYKKGSGDISRACAQRKDHERTRRQPSQAHTRGLGRKQTCDVALQAPRTVAKVTICGTLLWQPEQTNSNLRALSQVGAIFIQLRPCALPKVTFPKLILPSHTVLCSSRCFIYRKAP